MITKEVRTYGDQHYGIEFYCPGCQERHVMPTQFTPDSVGAKCRWTWNGDYVKPVFSPSLLCRSYRYPHPYEPDTNPEHAEIRAKFEEAGVGGHEWMMNHPKWGRRCHSFVGCNGAQPGEIIFLGDCTHALAGKVVPLPPLKDDWVDTDDEPPVEPKPRFTWTKKAPA